MKGVAHIVAHMMAAGGDVNIEEEFKRSPQESGHDTTADG